MQGGLDMSSGNHLVHHTQTGQQWRRRDFVKSVAALAGAAGLSAYDMRSAAAEPPSETDKVRLIHAPNYCLAPQYLAEEFLHMEGFSRVQYVESEGASFARTLVAGQVDFTMTTVPDLLLDMDAGTPLVVLAGIHAGCYELFGNDSIRTLRDFKERTIAITSLGSGDHIFIASMAAYVGLNPTKDLHWIESQGFAGSMKLFVDGKVDAFLAFPPQPQELRAQKIGHVVIDTVRDRPWSQYYCCVVVARRDFVQKFPIAAKRVLRAYLKAADVCAREPTQAARYFVDKGYEPNYDRTLEVVKSLPYYRWREANAEDTLRFHLLRLHEFGMIKSSPQKIIAQGTDWRFLNELKRELKA